MAVDKISKKEAALQAESLRKLASTIEDLLNKTSKQMEDINDEDTGMYQGDRKPSELRAELDEYRATFSKFHSQIDRYAGIIDTIVATMSDE